MDRRLWPRSDLRVGDAERRAVVAELQRHFVDGRLTSEELSERVGQALNARTYADLAMPLADLPPLPDNQASSTNGEWYAHLSPSIGAVLVLIGVLALLSMFVFPMGHFGIIPFWPILIWGFFFVGRPYRGGPRRF